MQKVLFYCRESAGLACKVARIDHFASARTGKINWEWFPNHDPDLFIKNVGEDVEGQDVVFFADFKRETMLDQLAIIYALPRYLAKSFKIILPYFPGTKDRVEIKGDVVTAKTLARLLSITPLSRGGPAELIVYDIHALAEQFYFGDDILISLHSAIPLLLPKLIRHFAFADEDYAVCFPDEGAWKRFGKNFEGWHQIICHKARLGQTRKIKIMEGNPKGRDVVIVDDLIMTGGTILECAHLLEKKGAKSVSAFATHAVFPNKSYFNMNKFPFANFWVTDSCPETIKWLKDCKTKFEVLSLAPSIAKILAN